MKTKSKLLLTVMLMTALTFMAGGCNHNTGELFITDGLYPYHVFYIYSAPLWTTYTGGPNHDETINYNMLTGLSTGKSYLVDDYGVLAFGGNKQKWMLMTEEKGLVLNEATLRSRRFAIRNVSTGRFINVKGLSVESMVNANQGEQVLLSDFEKDDAFFWGINPQVFMGKGMPVIFNANVVSSLPNYFGAGILCLLGNAEYETMKPSENNEGLYAVQYLYGARGEHEYNPEYISYSPNPPGCAFFCFDTD